MLNRDVCDGLISADIVGQPDKICRALTQNRKRKEVFLRTGKDQERKKGGSWKERRELMGEKTEERKVEAREMNVEWKEVRKG